jgi:hypothetical protein
MEGKRLAIDSSIWLYQVRHRLVFDLGPASELSLDNSSKLQCEIKMGEYWSTHMFWVSSSARTPPNRRSASRSWS